MFSLQTLLDDHGVRPGAVFGDPGVAVLGASTPEEAASGDLLFATDAHALRACAASPAAAVLVDAGVADVLEDVDLRPAAAVVEDARGVFLRVLPTLKPRARRRLPAVSKAAYVHPSATLGEGCDVRAGATIGEHAVLGDRCRVMPGAHVGAGCRIGADCTLGPNAVLYDGVVLGDRVGVQAGAVLGADGHGYETVDGRHRHLPHHGGVRVGDDAVVGANTTVARGMIVDTVVGEGTKLDAQVVVAHNCRLGPHNLICSQVGFAGSITTGSHVVAAGQVGIADHVTVGDGVVLASKTGVHRSLPGPGTFFGIPCQPMEDATRQMIAARKVPELRKTVRRLEKQVAALTARLEATPVPSARPTLREAA